MLMKRSCSIYHHYQKYYKLKNYIFYTHTHTVEMNDLLCHFDFDASFFICLLAAMLGYELMSINYCW